MLVLTRFPNQKLYIKTTDGLITVVVLDARSDRVRLGIDAPRSVEIERDDIKKSPYEREAQ